MKSKPMRVSLVFTAPAIGSILLILVLSGLALAHGWKAPKEASIIKNPLKAEQMNILAGKELYMDLCSSCHGINAEGGAGLDLDMKPVPPDLVKRLKGHSDGDFFWKIKTGKGEMPSFEDDLDEKETWQIITFIRSLIAN